MALFVEHGYPHVTIEQIAQASGVAVQSVYNYFGTKPGIVLHGAGDEQILADATAAVSAGEDFAIALRTALTRSQRNPVEDRAALRRRVALMFTEPDVLAAYLVGVDTTAVALARCAIDRDRAPLTATEAYPQAASTLGRLVGALRAWHLADDAGDPTEEMLKALG